MRIRLTVVTALLLLLAPLTMIGPGTARAQIPSPGPTNSSETNAPPAHRFFFANAQRESLTGPVNARTRMRRMTAQLRTSGADLGVLVELEGHQPDYFRAATDQAWGLIAGADRVRDSVVYRRDTWTPVARQIVPTYWSGGSRQHTPVVVLADRTGFQVAVIPVHNPHDSARLSAINNRRILAAVEDLQGQQIPVVVAGDFNSGRAAMCRYTRHPQAMASASHHRPNPCHGRREARIDQAFATPDLTLRHYREIPSRATDHGFVYAITLQHQR